jgi:hypothetical protein
MSRDKGQKTQRRKDGDLLARCVPQRHAPVRTDLRSGVHADVQLLAGAGRYELDVLIRVLGDNRIDIVGQVTDAKRVYEPVRRLSLVLHDADAMEIVASLETDAFGEFALRGLSAARYILALGSARDAPCVIIWEGGKVDADHEAAV